MKICPVGAKLFHSDGGRDGQTDITKLIVTFRNFANVPENVSALVYRTATVSSHNIYWMVTLMKQTVFSVRYELYVQCI